ncbi:hypothetical protein OC5_03130 [Vibrio cyclitrophicus ZF264]|uniref:WecB/TagA/CpsF family glycosyltransferase n=1 Tax=Vibrio cyclitrophicus TaxID=47951 RepID=UPI00035D8FC7|nr:WecB/TagA/CpsF family glycosyltransferase [Vibrio cyclitrophicus]OEE04360.1 hypothetical protein OC5_03130 [Vibrio cyclitrophicus ZF264]
MKAFNLEFVKTKNLLNKLNIVNENDKIDNVMNEIFSNRKCISISFLNFHALNLSLNCSTMESSLIESDYLFRDGVGVEKLMKWSLIPPGLNMNGTDLIPNILNYSMKKKRKVVLIGSEELNVKSCRHKLMKQGVDVVVSVNGFLDESDYIDVLSELKGESLTIILGMGMPKQELFSIKVKTHFFNEDFVIVSGGAIIDRLSGKVNRGPRFLVNNNLEWLYRFYSEPKRLFNRIVIGGGRFLFFAIRFSIKSRALAQ